jgi:hypothetical protein
VDAVGLPAPGAASVPVADVRADHAQRRRRARRTALLHGLIAFGFFVAVIVEGIGAAH